MQILELCIYSHAGRRRSIAFATGRLNVITGESQSGKSAIVEIVRYCLGSGDFRVPAGTIADSVAWYGLRLAIGLTVVFVGRPAPEEGRQSNARMMLRVGHEVPSPDFSDLSPNTNADAVVAEIGRLLRIGENAAPLPQTASRPPVEATLSHALFFCIQRQSEVADQTHLFHRQSEDYVSTAIRDTLPYFIGAVPPDYIVLRERLRRMRADLRSVELHLARLAEHRDSAMSEASALLVQAMDVGLAERRDLPEDASISDLHGWLTNALDAPQDAGAALTAGHQSYEDLITRRSEASHRFNELQRTHTLLTQMLNDQASFEETSRLHLEHMEPVQTLTDELEDTCPLCGSNLPITIPQLSDLRQQYQSLRDSVEEVGRDEPRLRRKLVAIEDEQANVRSLIDNLNSSLSALGRQASEVERLGTLLNQQSYVRGRIDYYLESAVQADDSSVAMAEADRERLREEIARLEENTSYAAVRDNVVSILNAVGEDMQRWAMRLALEHSDNPVRIDLQRLTVVADSRQGPVALTRMGSAANWVGYHLVAHLALHKLFVGQDRPVPRFLLLDQITQAFYPPDMPAGSEPMLTDADRQAVQRMFDLLRDVSELLAPSFQIIVLDHENPDGPSLPPVVVEEWRHGLKLIPSDWLE